MELPLETKLKGTFTNSSQEIERISLYFRESTTALSGWTDILDD